MENFLNDIGLVAGIALLVYGLAFAVQLFYGCAVYARLIFYKPDISRIRKEPVSVIICARNEEANLRKNLPLILEQKYPDFEVIVINDCSSDGTEDYLDELKSRYPVLKTTKIREDKKFSHGKKLALTVGIKASTYDLLLFTDADCRPESDRWIDSMHRNFFTNTSLVLGYGGYTEGKGLLNTVIRFDTLYIAIQYFSFALFGRPYMGVGRNLAYRKSLYYSNKGFASHSHLLSGDDDLFVNETANRTNTRIETSKESHTRSEPARTWKEWYFQKKRHLSTGPDYKTLSKFLLSLEIGTRILFYAGFIFLLVTGSPSFPIVLIPFIIRLGIFITLFKIVGNRLNERHLLLPSPLLDLLLPVFYFIILFINYVEAKRSRWK